MVDLLYFSRNIHIDVPILTIINIFITFLAFYSFKIKKRIEKRAKKCFKTSSTPQ